MFKLNKIVPLLFFLLIFFGQIGYHFIYIFQQHEIKEKQELEVLKKLPRNLLQRIENNDKIEWEEEGREFYLDNALYDVVETTKENNKIVYYVINDKHEKKIIDQLASISKQLNEHNSENKQGQKIVKLEIPFFLLETTQINFIPLEVLKKKHIIHQDRIMNTSLFIDAPPPKI
jgi:hypothetical protein